jgi:uracil-DNA glycosylase family 4
VREHALVRPALKVALGATAARSLFGKTVTVKNLRGKIGALAEWGAVLVTIHPSLLLRIPDAADKRAEQKRFVRDLRVARDFLANL